MVFLPLETSYKKEMLFNSLEYLIFLFIVVCIYYTIARKHQWLFLLICSFWFYMSWNVKHTFLLLFCIWIAFGFGRLIEQNSGMYKKIYLGIGIAINLTILGIYKYYNFFAESLQYLLNKVGIHIVLWQLTLLLPIGISFFIFKILSYLIDVYRGEMRAADNIGKFALYVAFFPEVVSGPIERPQYLMEQFKEIHVFEEKNIMIGFQRIVCGIFKKLVVADRLAICVDSVYGNIGNVHGQSYFWAALFFTFQIYFDFSSYSDIAIGSAKILGFDLKENFRRPYLSKSIVDFWRRWHISLSSWFRDYLYIPLGGNRKGFVRWGINIIIVFLLSGLWHGAEWSFIVWGGVHAILQIVERVFGQRKVPERVKIFILPVQIIINLFLVAIAWIFFRADTYRDAIFVLKNLFLFSEGFQLSEIGMKKPDFILAILLIILFGVVEIIEEFFNIDLQQIFCRFPYGIRVSIYVFALMFVIMFGIYGNLSESSFIYLQF